MCARERRSCCCSNAYNTYTISGACAYARECEWERKLISISEARSAAHLICKSHSLGRWCGALEIGSDGGGGVFRTLCLSNKRERIVRVYICARSSFCWCQICISFIPVARTHNCSFVYSTRGRLRHVSLNDNWRRCGCEKTRKRRRRFTKAELLLILWCAFSISLTCLLLACAIPIYRAVFPFLHYIREQRTRLSLCDAPRLLDYMYILGQRALHYTIHLLPVEEKLQSGSSEYISARVLLSSMPMAK